MGGLNERVAGGGAGVPASAGDSGAGRDQQSSYRATEAARGGSDSVKVGVNGSAGMRGAQVSREGMAPPSGGSAGASAASGVVPGAAGSTADSGGAGQHTAVLDKQALRDTLVSLLEDDRFVEMLHARYVAFRRRRGSR